MDTKLQAIVTCGLLAIAAPVHAILIDGTTSVGNEFVTKFLLAVGETDNGGNTNDDPNAVDLTATITYTVTSISYSSNSLSSLSLSVLVENTTNGFDERITTFGFDTNPELAVSSFTPGSTFHEHAEDTNFPAFQTIEFCASVDDNPNNNNNPSCGGSFPDGLAPSNSDTVLLSFTWAGGPLSIDPTVVKFQGDLGSFEFDNYCENGDCDPPNEVPEPGILTLLGLGLVGLHVVRRRRGDVKSLG